MHLRVSLSPVGGIFEKMDVRRVPQVPYAYPISGGAVFLNLHTLGCGSTRKIGWTGGFPLSILFSEGAGVLPARNPLRRKLEA